MTVAIFCNGVLLLGPDWVGRWLFGGAGGEGRTLRLFFLDGKLKVGCP